MKSIKKKWSCASHCKLHFQKVLGIMIVALAFLLTGNANAQESKTIKGVVRDATGEPLIGASVIEKGTNNGHNSRYEDKGNDNSKPDRKSTRLNSSHRSQSRMPSSA